jgi:hypothetical protein
LNEKEFGRQFTDLLPMIINGSEQRTGNNIVSMIITDNIKIRDSRDVRRNGCEIPNVNDVRRALEYKLGGKINWSTPDDNEDWVVLRANTDFDFSLYKPNM